MTPVVQAKCCTTVCQSLDWQPAYNRVRSANKWAERLRPGGFIVALKTVDNHHRLLVADAHMERYAEKVCTAIATCTSACGNTSDSPSYTRMCCGWNLEHHRAPPVVVCVSSILSCY
ncbi:unnamed protein product [Polarella glacialis]|uniref:Uncharacterized protein n=1 Tax=Polarella glacialis TaxID=89957 RepID=A0A813IR22_POLGL|nr:unnamed protein product [Polarella glacialis]